MARTGVRPLKNLSEVTVIGGGLAGLAAARHAARLGRFVTLFEGTGMYGGQVATLGHVDGLPFPGSPSGQELAIALYEDLQKVGVRIVEWPIAALDLGASLSIVEGGGATHLAEAVIVASGASPRKLGVPGEEEFLGRGVSRCATCDGGFYRGKHVAVIGGGDGAIHEALELSGVAGKVTMVCRSPLSGKREYINRLVGRDNVDFLWDREVTAILGETGVTALALRDVRDGTTSQIEVNGVFPFIGVEPATAFVPGALRNDAGLVVTNEAFATADPRLFAAGAARAGYGGNAVQAMAEGVSAAESAVRLLTEKGV